jgi:hypothetical protein
VVVDQEQVLVHTLLQFVWSCLFSLLHPLGIDGQNFFFYFFFELPCIPILILVDDFVLDVNNLNEVLDLGDFIRPFISFLIATVEELLLFTQLRMIGLSIHHQFINIII